MKRHSLWVLFLVFCLSSPVWALTADAEHDVLVIEEIDLAVKFNKKSFVPIQYYQHIPNDMPDKHPYFGYNPLWSFQIYENYSAVSVVQTIQGNARIGIEAYPGLQVGKKHRFFSPRFKQRNRLQEKAMTKEDFVAGAGLTALTAEQVTRFACFEAQDLRNQYKYPIYVWEMGDKTYGLAKKDEKGAIVFELEQNTLAPSESTINLDDPANQVYRW